MCVRISSYMTMDAIHSISCSVYYHLIILCDRSRAHCIHYDLFLSYSDHITSSILYETTLSTSRHTARIARRWGCPNSFLYTVIILDGQFLYRCFLHEEVLHHFIRRVYLKYHYHHKDDRIIRSLSRCFIIAYGSYRVWSVYCMVSL